MTSTGWNLVPDALCSARFFFFSRGDVSQVGDRCCNIDSLSGNQSLTKAERVEAREEALGFCLLHNPENSCFA